MTSFCSADCIRGTHDVLNLHIGLIDLPLWTVLRRLLGFVSARESFHRDRRQASSGLTSLDLVLQELSLGGATFSLSVYISVHHTVRVTLALHC